MFHPAGIILSVIGAVILLVIMRYIQYFPFLVPQLSLTNQKTP